ncbi:MAG: DUF3368 domain-containing protein [Chloroflexi bacterium]|nr:DUF3368 domain-containing protein [Chloroflexota bacterium]
MIVVSDSSPLILLSKVGHLHLLPNLYDHVLIPPAVHQEVVAFGRGRAGTAEVAAAPWITVRSAPDLATLRPAPPGLGQGEREAIALCDAIRPTPVLLIDDGQARKYAEDCGLKTLGSVGVLLRAKRDGLIPALRPPLDAMRAGGMYLTDAFYRRLLASAGEAAL